MSHNHSTEPETILFTQDWWDTRYRQADRIWSGNPNVQLVAQVAQLSPGAALDVGSGEGADAIWLAARGWRVTAVDVSPVALERGAQRAVQEGREIADRITWQQVDLMSWDPAPLQFDLVSAQFMYLPRPFLESLHRRLAAAVRVGGSLLMVGHHPIDLETHSARPTVADLMYTAEQIAATLDPDAWRIEVGAPERQAPLDPAGQPVTIHDSVMHAVRQR